MEHDDAPLQLPQQLTSAENNTQQLTSLHIKTAVVCSSNYAPATDDKTNGQWAVK